MTRKKIKFIFTEPRVAISLTVSRKIIRPAL